MTSSGAAKTVAETSRMIVKMKNNKENFFIRHPPTIKNSLEYDCTMNLKKITEILKKLENFDFDINFEIPVLHFFIYMI